VEPGDFPGRIDPRPLFAPSPDRPVLPQQIALWHYRAEDRHSLQEIFYLPDGRRFVCAHSFDTQRDRQRVPNSYTAAFDPQGRPLWVYRPDPGYTIKSHLFAGDGTTLVVSRGEGPWDGSLLVALNPQGVEMWRFASPGRQSIDSVRRGPDGTLYVKMGDQVAALKPDGTKKWTRNLGLHTDEFFHEAAPDGRQIFVNDNFSLNFGYDSFRALGPGGKVSDLDLPDIGTFPLAVGHRLVYGGEKGEIHGIDLAGGTRWEVATPSEGGLSTPFLGLDGNIYVEGRHDHRLYAVSPDGRLLWQRTVDDRRPGGGLESTFFPDRDGSVWYALEGDALQEIRPDGQPGRTIRIPDGFDSFRPGGDGRLYAYGDGVLSVYDLEKDQLHTLRLDLEHPRTWDLTQVLPGGVVELRCLDEVYHLQPDRTRQEELKEALKRSLVGEAPASPGIEQEKDWVRIGDVRLPVRA
jgi:outer membrane protein assembly factor BamB